MWFYNRARERERVAWHKIFGLSINVIIISNQAGRIVISRCDGCGQNIKHNILNVIRLYGIQIVYLLFYDFGVLVLQQSVVVI